MYDYLLSVENLEIYQSTAKVHNVPVMNIF